MTKYIAIITTTAGLGIIAAAISFEPGEFRPIETTQAGAAKVVEDEPQIEEIILPEVTIVSKIYQIEDLPKAPKNVAKKKESNCKPGYQIVGFNGPANDPHSSFRGVKVFCP